MVEIEAANRLLEFRAEIAHDDVGAFLIGLVPSAYDQVSFRGTVEDAVFSGLLQDGDSESREALRGVWRAWQSRIADRLRTLVLDSRRVFGIAVGGTAETGRTDAATAIESIERALIQVGNCDFGEARALSLAYWRGCDVLKSHLNAIKQEMLDGEFEFDASWMEGGK